MGHILDVNANNYLTTAAVFLDSKLQPVSICDYISLGVTARIYQKFRRKKNSLNSFTFKTFLGALFTVQQSKPATFSVYSYIPLMRRRVPAPTSEKKKQNLFQEELSERKVLINLPGGVQASAGDWTNVDRLLVGMGKAIFCSLCFASAA